jgi:hypothetical protein
MIFHHIFGIIAFIVVHSSFSISPGTLRCAQIVYSDFVIGEDGSERPWDEWVASGRLRAP